MKTLFGVSVVLYFIIVDIKLARTCMTRISLRVEMKNKQIVSKTQERIIVLRCEHKYKVQFCDNTT